MAFWMGLTRQQILAKYRARYTELCSRKEGFSVDFFEKLGLEAGAQAKPVFSKFTQWVLSEAKELGVDQVWFSGRDSLPLVSLVAQSESWRKSGLTIATHPFCRGNLYFVYDKRFDANKAIIQKQEILDYYSKLIKGKSSVAIVDFGFFGTLERTHRLILEESGIDTSFIKGHRLFLKAPKAVEDLNVFDKGISKKFFDNKKLYQLVESDTRYGELVKGYFDVKMAKRPKFMKNGYTYEELDLPFVFWLQESGSGIKDSRFHLSHVNYDEIRFGSAQQLCYWQSFAKGITESNDNGFDIEDLYQWFKINESALREMIAIEDRDICKVIPTYENLIQEMNQELTENGFQMATLVDSEVWPIPS